MIKEIKRENEFKSVKNMNCMKMKLEKLKIDMWSNYYNSP